MLLFQLALRNALRNRRRSLLTALMVTAGIGLLMLGMAWIHGVLGGALHAAANIAGHARIVTPGYVQKEQLFPLADNLAQTKAVVEAAGKVPGVKGVYERISMPVTFTVGEELGEKFTLLQGASPGWYTDVMDLPAHLEEGRMMEGDKEIVLGKEAAAQAGARLGDTVIVLGQTQDGALSPGKFTVTGIADMGNTGQNRISYVTLEKARYLTDIPEGALEVLVYGEEAEAMALAATLRGLPETKDLTVQAWNERSPYNGMQLFADTISFIAAGLIVFITGLGMLNTMLMSVLERTAEIGVMRAMGLKKWETVLLFATEAMGIAAVGGVLGSLSGATIAYFWLEKHGINLGGAAKSFPSAIPINTVVYGEVTADQLVTGFLLGLAMAVVGSVVPALRASTIEPVEAMRTRK